MINYSSKSSLELSLSGTSLTYMGPGSGLTGIGCLIGLLLGSWYTIKVFVDLAFQRWFKKTEKMDKSPEKEDSINGPREECEDSGDENK